MSVRFAPARTRARLIGWHAQARGLMWAARNQTANDNGDAGVPSLAFDPLLTDALKHFAVHGLSAIDAALSQAEDACAQGNTIGKQHWLAVSGMFDRRRSAGASALPFGS